MPDLYVQKQYVEDQISLYRERFVPLILTTSLSTRQLTIADPTLILVNGSTTGYNLVLPDATTLENGYHITVHNESTATIDVDTYGGAHYLQMTVGSRMVLFLKDNSTQMGLWVRTVTSSSPFTGTSPLLASYNGNATTGRYLEIFPGQGSGTAPFYVPTNAYVVAFEFSTPAASTASLGIFKTTDLVTPIYTVSLSAAITTFGTNLTVPVYMSDRLCFRITAGSATKPRMAMYFTGV